MPSTQTRPGRAAPLAPDDRRRAIIDAVTPLLVADGTSVTTRQMAEAAGVAEGTIFSVFPDKSAVVRAVLEASMDPAPVCDALAAIEETAPLHEQLSIAARAVEERSRRIWALGPLLRTLADPDHAGRLPAFVTESGEAIMQALTSLLERHRDRLRVEPSRAAIAFRGLMFANGYPTVGPRERLDTDELIDLLLSGIAAT